MKAILEVILAIIFTIAGTNFSVKMINSFKQETLLKVQKREKSLVPVPSFSFLERIFPESE